MLRSHYSMFLRGFFQSQRLYSCHSRNKSVFLQFMCHRKCLLFLLRHLQISSAQKEPGKNHLNETSATIFSSKPQRVSLISCSFLCTVNLLLFSAVKMSLWFSFLERHVHVSHPSNFWISFLKSATKNYYFVLPWIHSSAPNISLSPPLSSSKHFTLPVA